MTAFTRHVADTYGLNLPDYEALHQWSIDHPADFWQTVWDWCSVVASRRGNTILEQEDQFPGARWFPDARLNFAENLLRYRDDQTALVGLIEGGERRSLSYAELWSAVEAVVAGLAAEGIGPGDTVAGYMPNIPETIVAMLATTSLGAVWTSCSPDFGLNGARDRFGQVEPRLLFTADAYRYNGKVIDCLERVRELGDAVPSIERVVVVPLIDEDPVLPDDSRFHTLTRWTDQAPPRPLDFVQLPFDHSLYIMYSSGTTGVPKCIVHGAGGTLLQHLKEHQLHTDIKREDVLFYFTTCGWMMWNWLASGLASGCTLVLYDGSPFAAKGKVLIDAIDNEGITVFGVGAKYIDSLEKADIRPAESHRLDTLKTILSTGSPLGRNSYDYIYRDFKPDVCLASISGGTDIISCFVLGNPNLPVYSGEIQCRGLGMAVEFWDDEGLPLLEEKGELVCTQPFPSVPIGFWNDPRGARYHDAYFSRFDGVWAHGDWGELTRRGGVVIYGRSDAVLNPGGVRIGTAEIYRQVETINEVLDSVVIGQQWEGDERVILFVVLRDGASLDEPLTQRIKTTIRDNATPRHVPAKIIAVPDIPRTISGKVVELAVKNVVHGRPVKNTDALANPEALDSFRDLPELV